MCSINREDGGHRKLTVHWIGLSSMLKSLRSLWLCYNAACTVQVLIHTYMIHILRSLSTSQNHPDLRQSQPVKSDSYHHGY